MTISVKAKVDTDLIEQDDYDLGRTVEMMVDVDMDDIDEAELIEYCKANDLLKLHDLDVSSEDADDLIAALGSNYKVFQKTTLHDDMKLDYLHEVLPHYSPEEI